MVVDGFLGRPMVVIFRDEVDYGAARLLPVLVPGGSRAALRPRGTTRREASCSESRRPSRCAASSCASRCRCRSRDRSGRSLLVERARIVEHWLHAIDAAGRIPTDTHSSPT
jgi:hypothetical protein